MKILSEEHFENVKRYAESIGDTSLQNCLKRLESWEENPDHPSEISLYMTMHRTRSASHSAILTEEPALWAGCFITGYRTGFSRSHSNRSTDGRYIPEITTNNL